MGLREMLSGVRDLNYRHQDGRDQPAQRHLQEVRREMSRFIPPGWRVLVSGKGRSLPIVPWIAVLDPDVTTTAQRGWYVVYLYKRDLSRIYLSMNQGATQHRYNAEINHPKGRRAQQVAFTKLRNESATVFGHLSRQLVDHLTRDIDLGAPTYFLPRSYEEGNVAAAEYDMANLPPEQQLQDDLTVMRAIYEDCVRIKKAYLESDPGRFSTPGSDIQPPRSLPPIFRPKDSSEYFVRIGEQVQQKSRRHEALVKRFAEWVKSQGLTPANNVHPRDLTVEIDGHHWLIEAKTVRTNGEHAAREAVGQLFSYRHFIYRERGLPEPELVALFSEPPGDAFDTMLKSLGIESIWPDGDTWAGDAPDDAVSLRKTALARPS